MPIGLGIKLRAGETACNALTAAHRIGIERSRKSCCPARVNIGMDIRDVPHMVAEYNGEVTEEPRGFQFLQAQGKARAGRGHVIDMDLQKSGKVGVEDERAVLVKAGKYRATAS